jgi:hypothetical protein
MSLVNQVRGGKDNDPRFGERMRGSGTFAALIKRRFDLTVKRLGLNAERAPLDRSLFRPPAAASPPPQPPAGDDRQGRLF